MDIQKEFEAIANTLPVFRMYFKIKGGETAELFRKRADGEYVYGDVRICFEIWKAAKASVAEGFVLVSKELPETIAEAMALERVPKPFGETDPVWIEISERSYRDRLLRKKWDLWRDYKAMIEAQEPIND